MSNWPNLILLGSRLSHSDFCFHTFECPIYWLKNMLLSRKGTENIVITFLSKILQLVFKIKLAQDVDSMPIKEDYLRNGTYYTFQLMGMRSSACVRFIQIHPKLLSYFRWIVLGMFSAFGEANANRQLVTIVFHKLLTTQSCYIWQPLFPLFSLLEVLLNLLINYYVGLLK